MDTFCCSASSSLTRASNLAYFSTYNSTKIICFIRIVKYKPTILFGSFKILYDVGHDYWWMFVASKLNVGLVVLLSIMLFCSQIFLCVVELMHFDAYEQQFELRYWISFKVCMHVKKKIENFITCVSICQIIITNSWHLTYFFKLLVSTLIFS
jgi:hypothetical protein